MRNGRRSHNGLTPTAQSLNRFDKAWQSFERGETWPTSAGETVFRRQIAAVGRDPPRRTVARDG